MSEITYFDSNKCILLSAFNNNIFHSVPVAVPVINSVLTASYPVHIKFDSVQTALIQTLLHLILYLLHMLQYLLHSIFYSVYIRFSTLNFMAEWKISQAIFFNRYLIQYFQHLIQLLHLIQYRQVFPLIYNSHMLFLTQRLMNTEISNILLLQHTSFLLLYSRVIGVFMCSNVLFCLFGKVLPIIPCTIIFSFLLWTVFTVVCLTLLSS